MFAIWRDEAYSKDCKQMNNGEGKGKENDSAYITESNGSDALILLLAESSESWVLTPMPSFMPLSMALSD